MRSKQCADAGHMFDVIETDKNYTYEQCGVCGHKERFSSHDNRNYYAEMHRADTMQAWDHRFALLYPEHAQRQKEEAKALAESEQDANDKLEQAAHAIKKSTMTTKFVH